MQDDRFGRVVHALRRRLGLRQSDVALRAGVPQSTVSRIEHGALDRLQVGTVRAVAEAVGSTWEPAVRWRGGELDRLIDERHAILVGAISKRLAAYGWDVEQEVTFSIYGERGSIDLLGWHAETRQLLVVEAKTMLASLEETLRRQDVKVRLARRIATDRYDRTAAGVSALLVFPDSSTVRRRVARHAAVLDRAYPLRGGQLRAWLREPDGRAAGLMFLSSIAPDDGGRGRGARTASQRPVRSRARGVRPPPIARDDQRWDRRDERRQPGASDRPGR
ncbi:MAG: helix-turn-helix domain-containing protein [Chloroflexi bacterium]|nr:helix-turn-helix domain-containing protein [Chloroflexota bacterium]